MLRCSALHGWLPFLVPQEVRSEVPCPGRPQLPMSAPASPRYCTCALPRRARAMRANDTSRAELVAAGALTVAATSGEIGPCRHGGRPLGIAELSPGQMGSSQIRSFEIGI